MKVAILGASGYVGGELLRILLFHPKAEVFYASSRMYKGMPAYIVHPNLRKVTDLKFEDFDVSKCYEADIVFSALPHGASMEVVPSLLKEGVKVIDLSADYRLKNPEVYKAYYGRVHSHPELLQKAVYGVPELHKEDIRKADLVAGPGCIAIAIILSLAPIVTNFDIDKIVSDVKIGSSAAGKSPTLSSHHPERVGVVRAYKLLGHRHIPEIEQELSLLARKNISIHLSAHAVDMVRGILSTSYIFLDEGVEEKSIWNAYRSFYQNEYFIRVFRAKRGVFRLADPKAVIGSNFCDISFEMKGDKLIVLSAIDNLVKGSAGNAVQCWNLMIGCDETTGLTFPGLYPA